MRATFLSAFVVLSFFLFSTQTWAQGRDEFNGPFKSWADVKKKFGASGNGKDDDTRSIQSGIDGLSNAATGFNVGADAYTVIYLPAGTYCISSTLLLKGKIGVSIIGEDPSNTFIKWTGKDSNMVLLANGSAYFKISRITWNANNRKGMEGIGIHWRNKWNDAKGRSFASLNIELSDNVFTGGFASGIGGGTTGGNDGTGDNDSEVAIKRCVFQNCTFAGIKITGYNALDYWIWDCRFLHCNYGVNCSYGNYHVFRSYFLGSLLGDTYNTNGYYTSIRDSYSENSELLSREEGMSCNPFKRTFQNNTVVRPRHAPIQYTHLGKLTLFDNKFDKQTDSLHKFDVYYGSFCPGNYEVLSLKNSYFHKDEPIKIYVNSYKKIYSYGDEFPQAITASSVKFINSMDKTPAYRSRKIFDVPAKAGGVAIQAILDQANAMHGQRPVVHFGPGEYFIDQPLVIPIDADMQLEGDGLTFSSIILRRASGLLNLAPLLIIKGPSYVAIRDLQFGKDGDRKQSASIVFENVDQPASQAHLDQIYSSADTSLLVDGTNNLYVQKDNSFFTYGNYIKGGDLVQRGKGTAAVVCYGGQFAGLTVKKNASFIAKDCWWEGASRVPLNISGSGRITIDGAMIAPGGADSLPTIRIGEFEGNISLMNLYVQGALSVQPDNRLLNLFVWNIQFYHKMNVLDFLRNGVTYKGVFAGLNAQCFRIGDPACKDIISISDQFRNIADQASFFEAMTAQDRANPPRIFTSLPAGASNIFISRVSLGAANRGIVLGGSN